MSFAPAAMVATARANVGYIEGYNNANPWTIWQTYGTVSHQPYCASFVSYCAYAAGFRFDASCTWRERGDWNVGAQHQWALRRGLWRDRNTRARPCWLAVESFGIPDQHVEMVYADAGGNVATIGGNTGNGVWFRSRPRYSIVGFIALDEAGQTGTAPPPPVAEPAPPPYVSEDTDVLIIRRSEKGKPPILLSGGRGMTITDIESLASAQAEIGKTGAHKVETVTFTPHDYNKVIDTFDINTDS